jgi:hypothetical protein
MIRRALHWSPVAASLAVLCGAAASSDHLSGFAPSSTTRERAVEAAFAAVPSQRREPAASVRRNKLDVLRTWRHTILQSTKRNCVSSAGVCRNGPASS